MTWLEIHGDRPDVVAHWRALQAEPRIATESSETPASAPWPRAPPPPAAGAEARARAS